MSTTNAIELRAQDLNAQGAVVCPRPQSGMSSWNSHPNTSLDVGKTGEARCPYCGTVYRLKAGESLAPGH